MKRILVLAAASVVFALAAAGDQDRLVTDRDVRFGGEGLDDEKVAMSCRMGAWPESWEAKGIFKPDDYALFTTKDEGVEVLVPKAKKGLWDALRQQKAGAEITVLGKVHWAKGIEPYLVIHDWKKGFSQDYDPRKPAPETIVLTFGGREYTMEKSRAYVLVTPKGEKVEASWGDK